MDKKFVRILCKLDCEWEGLPPVYRLYVNGELFSERTWTWRDSHLQEALQIEAIPGDYAIRHELVAPHLAFMHIKDLAVDVGPAQVLDHTQFRIV
jgi:hypothetical protein